MDPPGTSNISGGTVVSGPHVTSEAHNADKKRVALILEINQTLLEAILKMQAEGKGGSVQSPANAASPEPSEQKKPAREWLECLKRVQANLAYLASLAERHSKPGVHPHPWPQVMSAPPLDNPKLALMYKKLQDLFPIWKVQQERLRQQAQQEMQPPPMPPSVQQPDTQMG